MPKVSKIEREETLRPIDGRGVSTDVAGGGLKKTQAEANKFLEDTFEKERLRASKLILNENETTLQQFGLVQYAEGGAFTQKGRDAVGVAGGTLAGFDQMNSELINNAPSEETRILIEEMGLRFRTKLQGQLNKHEFEQYEVVESEVYTAGLASNIDYASSADVNLVEGLKNVEVSTNDFWIEKGKDKSFRDVKVQEAQSTIIIASMDRLRAEGQDDKALELFNDKRSQKILTTDQKSELRPKLEDGSRLQKAQSKTNEIMLEGGTVESQLKKARQIKDGKLQDEVVKRVKARNTEKKSIRDAAVKANNEATWSQLEQLRRDGTPDTLLQPIIDNVEPRAERAKMNTWLKLPAKELKEEQKIEQQINYSSLSLLTPNELREEDLDSMVRTGELSRVGFNALQKLADPRNSQRAKTATQRLKDAKTKKLFSLDPEENSARWAEMTELLTDFIVRHPDEDYGEFVNEQLEPVELEWNEKFKDLFFIGQPGTEEALERRTETLEERAGRKARVEAPVTAAPVEGATATNPTTGEQLILKDGKWQTVTK